MTTPPKAKARRHSDCLDSLVEDSAENDDSLEDESLSPRIEIPYDILTIIFKNLNAKDLHNAAQVCRCWYEAASIEKRVRVAHPVVLLGNLVNSWRDLSPGKPLIDNVKTKPMFGFMFTQYNLSENRAFRKEDCPCRMLPSKCPLLKVGSNGIVKDHLEMQLTNKAVLLLLPHDNEVTIDTMYAPFAPPKRRNRGRNRNLPNISDDDDLANLNPGEKYSREIRKYPFAEKEVKCFVLLSDEDLIYATAILDSVPRDDQRTLSGCVVGDLKLCKNSKGEKFCSKRLGWLAILISGPNVRSWTAILPSTIRTKEAVLTQLQKLRGKVLLQKHSVAFMFACEGRGESMFREPNVEASTFKQLFPEVPLVGCSGGGEFGNCSIQRMSRLDHHYSTVFMIVTYGKLAKNS